MEIELPNEVRQIIDDYMKNSTHLALGYESHGIQTFADECKDFFDDFNWNRILSIKAECCQYSKSKEYGYYKRIDKKSINYFDGMHKYNYVWSKPYIGFRGSFSDYIESACLRYFKNNIMTMITPYINEKYGDLERAICQTDSFIELWNGFDEWFDDRRKKFMEKMEVEIKNINALAKNKKPQSHGGVANLLKVLTKTMHDQGADITSIAKVQYAVCTQAGIYIPDEFIRDVAVAMDITDEVADGN